MVLASVGTVSKLSSPDLFNPNMLNSQGISVDARKGV